MIKTMIAATVIAAATTAGAQSEYSGDHNLVFTPSAQGSDLSMAVTVDPRNGCQPQFVIGGPGYNPIVSLSYEMRVDRQTPWQVTGVTQNTDGHVFFKTDAKQQLLNELRRGRVLRVKLPQKGGGFFYDSYNLNGFSRALSKAKAACIPPSRYFDTDTTTSNEEYFL